MTITIQTSKNDVKHFLLSFVFNTCYGLRISSLLKLSTCYKCIDEECRNMAQISSTKIGCSSSTGPTLINYVEQKLRKKFLDVMCLILIELKRTMSAVLQSAFLVAWMASHSSHSLKLHVQLYLKYRNSYQPEFKDFQEILSIYNVIMELLWIVCNSKDLSNKTPSSHDILYINRTY